MKIKTLRLFASLSLLLVGTGGVSSIAFAEDKQPNFLFIFADDLTFQAVHALGNRDVKTPNIDRLASRGMTFTHAYNPGAWGGAVCVASRTMLLTGKFLWQARADYNKTDEIYRQTGKMWPQTLEAHGYDTYFSGKWHVQAPADKAFQTARHIRPGMPNQTPEGYHRPKPNEPDVWSPYDPKFEGFWKGGKHWSEVLADDAEEYLEVAANDDSPFFMYLAFNAPHDPRQAPKEYVDMYDPDQLTVPANFLPEYPWDIGSNKIRDEIIAPFPRTDHIVQVHLQEYYAIISHMDAQIGRILHGLEKTGKADNTYIVFTADHGLAVGSHGLMGKQNQYEHSVRVPFIVVGPNVPQGSRVSEPVYLQDIHPTTFDLAGIKKPDHVDFQSLAGYLQGDYDCEHYSAVYGAYTETQRMAIHDGFKLIVYPKIGKSLLFDLKADPDEMKDLSDSQCSKTRELFQVLLKQQAVMGDPLDLIAAFPELAGV